MGSRLRLDFSEVIAFAMVCCCTSCDNSSGAFEGPTQAVGACERQGKASVAACALSGAFRIRSARKMSLPFAWEQRPHPPNFENSIKGPPVLFRFFRLLQLTSFSISAIDVAHRGSM
jgi:hypothetical protein